MDGTTEWISEEACGQYLDCLVHFTSRGIEQADSSEEMDAESKKDSDSLDEAFESDELGHDGSAASQAMDVIPQANTDFTGASVNNAGLLSFSSRSIRSLAGKKEGVTLMKSDQKEKIIQDVKKIVDVRERNNVCQRNDAAVLLSHE